MADADTQTRRQVIYWQLLASAFGQGEHAPNVGALAHELADELGLPAIVLDPVPSIDTVLQRYPELRPEFDALEGFLAGPPPAASGEAVDEASLRRGLVYSKLLLNVFGPNAHRPVTASSKYRVRWCSMTRFSIPPVGRSW